MATCVFCSVADPVTGLRKVARVVRPGGRVLMIVHVRPRTSVLGWLFDQIDPIVRRIVGPNVNRPTEDPIAQVDIDVIEIVARS